MTEKEVADIRENLEKIKPFMSKKGLELVESSTFYENDEDDLPATKLIGKKECCFAYFDESGTAKCAIETSYEHGEVEFKKPVSCHLYPIRIKDFNEFKAINYEKWSICDPACELGSSLNIPVFKFLKEPLIRVFGEAFYRELETIETELSQRENREQT